MTNEEMMRWILFSETLFTATIHHKCRCDVFRSNGQVTGHAPGKRKLLAICPFNFWQRKLSYNISVRWICHGGYPKVKCVVAVPNCSNNSGSLGHSEFNSHSIALWLISSTGLVLAIFFANSENRGRPSLWYNRNTWISFKSRKDCI